MATYADAVKGTLPKPSVVVVSSDSEPESTLTSASTSGIVMSRKRRASEKKCSSMKGKLWRKCLRTARKSVTILDSSDSEDGVRSPIRTAKKESLVESPSSSDSENQFPATSSSDDSSVSRLLNIKEEDVQYLRGNADIPYIPWAEDFANKDVVAFLMNPPAFVVCRGRPTVCHVNAIFTIDKTSLKDENDVKSDEYSWRNNGSKTYNVVISGQQYTLTKTYFVHKKHKDFKRRLLSISQVNGGSPKFMMLCYLFDKKEHTVTPTKKVSTQKSTLKAMVQKLKQGQSARDVYIETRENEGGIVGATTVSSLPRSLYQVHKLKQRMGESANPHTNQRNKDELYAVIVKCVEESTQKDRFIRFVQGAPQPLAFLCDDRQLDDLERFCTNPYRPGILSVDTTYNCGEFYVTPTTYRHQMLRSKRSGNHPVLLGPTLIHKHKDEEAFGYLANCLVRLRPNLTNILAVGSDRDKAIKNGFTKHLPGAVFIACKKHFEDDVKRKLTELGINGHERNTILRDIFGCDSSQQLGLLDRSSSSEFDKDLSNLKFIWDELERNARNTTSPMFHAWFLRYQAKDAKDMLLYPIRRDLGLGYGFYYNNDVESVHRNIKMRQNYRASDMPTVIENIRREKNTNFSYLEDSIIGNGPYKLDEEFSKHGVDHHTWTYDMSEAQKKKHLNNFHKATVTDFASSSSSATNTSSNTGTAPSASYVDSRSSSLSQDRGESDKEPSLSIPFCETGLSSIFKPAYVKAAQLRRSARNIMGAPGDHNGFMVASESDSAPHFVTVKKGGECVCPCRGYKTALVCSHTLAVADVSETLDKFLVWFLKNGGPNITNASSTTAPKNTGKKPCQNNRNRVRKRDASQRNEAGTYTERRPLSTSEGVFNFRWLSSCKAQVCYGCGGKLRPGPSGVPAAPHDLVLTTVEYRSWYDKESKALKVTTKPDRTHYHLNPVCVWQKNPEFKASDILLTRDDHARFTDLHKQFIQNALNTTVSELNTD